MQLSQALKVLHENPVFKSWAVENKNCFLAYAFVMLDEENKGMWQIGYYCKERDDLTTFIVKHNNVSLIKNQEIFKSDEGIKELNIANVKIEVDGALEIAENCREEHYPNEEVFKTFFIIQNLSIGEVYNLTYLTKSFKAINIKISVKDGKILQHSINLLVGKG